MQKGGPKAALSLAPDRRSYAAPATSRRARRAAGMSRNPSPFTSNVAACKATRDAPWPSKSQTSSAAALSSRSIHSRSSIRGPMHDASRAAHTRAECSSWSRKSRQRLLPRARRDVGELVANPIGFDFDFEWPERSAIGHDKFGWRRRQVEPGGRGSQRPLVGLTHWQQAGMRWASAKARPSQGLGIAARAGADREAAPAARTAPTTARRLTSTVTGPPPLRRPPRD